MKPTSIVIPLPSITFNCQSKEFGIGTEVLMDRGLSINPWSSDSCMLSISFRNVKGIGDPTSLCKLRRTGGGMGDWWE